MNTGTLSSGTSTEPAERPGLTSALRQTITLLCRKGTVFLALSPIYWVPNLLYTFLPFPTFEDALSEHRYLSELGGLFDLGMWILVATPYQVAVLYWILREAGQKPFVFARVYWTTAALFFPVLALNAATVLLVLAGLSLFILPGLVVLAALALAPAAYVFEQDGIMGAIHRSWALSRGYRLRFLAILAVAMAAAEGSLLIVLDDPYESIAPKPAGTDVAASLLYHLADWTNALVSTALFAIFFQQIWKANIIAERQ